MTVRDPPPGGEPPLAAGALLLRGAALFNGGRYFEAHEVLEDVWRAETDPTLRSLWQGLVQVAVGLAHLERGNPHGARTLLARGLTRLQALPEDRGGLALAGFLAGLARCSLELARLGNEACARFDRSLVPRLPAPAADGFPGSRERLQDLP